MTADFRCVICAHNQPHEGWIVCRRCLDRTDDDLSRIVELVRIASAWLSPRTGTGGTGRSVPSSRPPLDIASLDASMATDVMPMLETWERMTREFYGLAPYGPASLSRNAALAQGGPITPTATVRGSTAFLRANLARMAETADYPLDDLAREIRELRISLERLDPDHDNGSAHERLLCPGDHPDADGRRCHNRIRLIPGRPKDDVYCSRCGTTWTTNRLKLLCLHDESQRIMRTPAEIIELVDVPKRTIQRWADKGLVDRDGIRYDLGAVWRLRMRVGA